MTLVEQEIIGLIREIYKIYPSGGALHIVLDDGNTEDQFIQWCIDNAIDDVEAKDQWMFKRCAELMLTISERKRGRAIVVAFNTDVIGNNIRQGLTKSCGCLYKERKR